MRSQVERINTDLAGMESFSIVLDSGIEGTFLKVRYIDELAKIQNYVAELGLSKSTTSFADYLAMLNGVFQELDHWAERCFLCSSEYAGGLISITRN